MDNDAPLATHQWRFVRTADFDQVLLESGADMAALPHLDQKLWAALSCPTSGIEFNTRMLAHLDRDKDGQIRVPDLLESVEWLGARLMNLDVLTDSRTELPLTDINDGTP